MRPLILDLFCCQGGAAMGYHRAGFDVIGVDITPQPRYPFPMVVADALSGAVRLDRFDAIHASPPCQGYTTMNNRHGSSSPKLIAETMTMLDQSGLPWIVENVMGARSEFGHAVTLTGAQFGLDLHRPRLFASNALLLAPPKAKRHPDAAAIYGKNDGRLLWTRSDGTELRVASLERAREAMGMPWADWDGVREAIPPAYTEFLGAQLLQHVEGRVAA